MSCYAVTGRLNSRPGCVQISILDYQIRFIAAAVFSCFNTQAIDVCRGKIALIIFHPYVISRDLPLNAQYAGLLNAHLVFKSAVASDSLCELMVDCTVPWEYENMKLLQILLTVFQLQLLFCNFCCNMLFYFSQDSAEIRECIVGKVKEARSLCCIY